MTSQDTKEIAEAKRFIQKVQEGYKGSDNTVIKSSVCGDLSAEGEFWAVIGLRLKYAKTLFEEALSIRKQLTKAKDRDQIEKVIEEEKIQKLEWLCKFSRENFNKPLCKIGEAKKFSQSQKGLIGGAGGYLLDDYRYREDLLNNAPILSTIAGGYAWHLNAINDTCKEIMIFQGGITEDGDILILRIKTPSELRKAAKSFLSEFKAKELKGGDPSFRETEDYFLQKKTEIEKKRLMVLMKKLLSSYSS